MVIKITLKTALQNLHVALTVASYRMYWEEYVVDVRITFSGFCEVRSGKEENMENIR